MTQPLYSRSQVEEWQANLEEIADQPRMTFTKKEVVEELIDTIEKTLKKRSYREVADGLKQWGLDISESALMKYVSQLRRAHKSLDPTEVSPSKSAKDKSNKNSKRKRSNSDSSSQKQSTNELAVSSSTTHPTVDNTTLPAVEAIQTTAVPKQKKSFIRTGDGRLKSDDTSTRYPGDTGKPISLSSEL